MDVFDEDFPKPMSLHKDTFYSSDSFTLKHETSEDNHDSHAGQKKLGLGLLLTFLILELIIIIDTETRSSQELVISC